jgi:hypothetical protein
MKSALAIGAIVVLSAYGTTRLLHFGRITLRSVVARWPAVIILFVGLAGPASELQASERITVCAKYETQYGWSKGYQVEASYTSGMSVVGQTGKDQRGRRWEISKGGLCF